MIDPIGKGIVNIIFNDSSFQILAIAPVVNISVEQRVHEQENDRY